MTSDSAKATGKSSSKATPGSEQSASNTRLGGIVAIAFCAFLLVFGIALMISGRNFNQATTIDFGALIRLGFGAIISLFSLLFIAVGISVLSDNNATVDAMARTAETTAEQSRTRAIEEITRRLPAVTSQSELHATMSKVLTELRSAPSLVQPASWLADEGLQRRYHQRAQTEAQAWFVLSIIGAVGAFVLILYAAFSGRENAVDTALSAVPSGVLGAVSALFFRQADVTRRRSTDLFDRLREDYQRAAARPLLESIEDKRLRDGVTAQLVLRMSGADANLGEISGLLSNPGSTNSTAPVALMAGGTASPSSTNGTGHRAAQGQAS